MWMMQLERGRGETEKWGLIGRSESEVNMGTTKNQDQIVSKLLYHHYCSSL